MPTPDTIPVNQLKFVILEHDWNGIHYDLMIQWQGKLKTWRLAEPLKNGSQRVEALADHRLKYLTYEGEVSGSRGTVKRVESGEYAVLEMNETLLKLQIQGTIKGVMSLKPLHDSVWELQWAAGATGLVVEATGA